jgi:cytidine deaminase
VQPPDTDTVERLIAAAEAAASRAYAPYSNFPVGAAVLASDGSVFTGCNVENASYGLTVCAERVAVWSAVTAGARAIEVVAVVAPRSSGVTPCGACRQVLNEFVPAGGELWVIIAETDGPESIPLSHLLPRAFGPRDLSERARG